MIGKLQRKILGSTIPVINVHGPIKPELAERVQKRLKQINTNTAIALAVSVNSPGGLPVQSQIICNKIKRFASDHGLKIYTFAHDLAASGGYFVLSIGNHVYVDRTSIVGSIGVIWSKMHVQGLLDATSISQKSISSSDYLLQDIMNPFKSLEQDKKQYVKQLAHDCHGKFINHVKNHRGNKIKIDDHIFSGEVYSGEQSVQNGLADEIGSIIQVLQSKYPGAKIDYERQDKTLKARIRNLM